MKKIILTLLCATMSIVCTAQENTVNRLPDTPKHPVYKDHTVTQTGYWFSTEGFFGTMADPNSKNLQFIGAQFVNGFRLNEFLRGGVGIGLKHYFKSDDVRTSTTALGFPLFANLRGNLLSQNDREIVPFWSIEAGTEIRTGYYVSPLVGFKIGEQRSSFTVGVSYTMIQMDTKDKDDDIRNCITLKFGYEF